MNKDKILKLNDIKERNVLSLLELLLRYDSLSRVELAEKMGCDNTTVTRAVRDLLARGLLISRGKTELMHGRPREQLSLDPDGKYVIGISLDPDGIIGMVTDLRGRTKVREQVCFQMRRTRTLFLKTLGDVTDRLLHFAGDRLAGIGVSTFGAGMDAGSGENDAAHFPALNSVNLRQFFLEKFRLEPEFSDTMLCRMYHELVRHPESRNGTTLMVFAASGIGMAVASDGRIISGAERHGGELGHNICEPDGLPCACGRRGCLETRCSTEALLKRAREIFHTKMSFAELASRYQERDPDAELLIDEAIRFFSVALANQINNLAPDHLILTGELFRLGERFAEILEQRIRALLFPFSSRNLKLVFREADEDHAAIGAALLVTARLMSSPDLFRKACPRPDESPRS